MKISESMICEYAKKVYGFAYSKTKNTEDAEDLSQNILTVLVGEIAKEKEIDNPDAYIYRICHYTWSKYLRKVIGHKSSVPFGDKIVSVYESKSIEEEVENILLFERLRQEIAYLGKVRREILISHYFDGKNSKEIAETFSLSPSTVRWHLGETRKDLKERLSMEHNEIYRPEKLKVHYTGNITFDSLLVQMKKDVLLQNICIVCYEREMTIQEIARKLSVAAIYIEDKIERLVYMDYLTEHDGKYRTNFHIKDTGCVWSEIQFILNNIEPIAKKIYEFSCELYDELNMADEFNLEKNKIIADAVMFITEIAWFNGLEKIQKNWCRPPKRKDGSEHWIFAYLIDDDMLKTRADFNERTYRYFKSHFGKGISNLSTPLLSGKIKCYHCDTYLHDVRNVNEIELIKLQQVHKIIKSGGDISENEKHIISDFVKEGLVSVKDGKAEFLVPYVTKKVFRKYYNVIKKAYKNSGIEEMIIDYILNYGQEMEKYIPHYLSEENRLHSKYYRAGMTYEVIFWLIEKGYLQMWREEDKQSSLFVVWEE